MQDLTGMDIAALKQADSEKGIDPASMDDFYVTVVFPLIERGLLESGFPIRTTAQGKAALKKHA
jgi:hypothetical protein